MASVDISEGDTVSIDGQGEGFVEKISYINGSLEYFVNIVGTDLCIPFDRNRLSLIFKENNIGAEQLTGPHPPVITETGSSETQRNNRFAVVATTSDIELFNHRLTNKGTMRKTLGHMKILLDFLKHPQINENRPIHVIPPLELSDLLCRFIISVRRLDGEEYEPTVLRGMICSIDRHLRSHKYIESVNHSPLFHNVRETLAKKQKDLKSKGKGNLPNKSDALSDEDIDLLWERKQLGDSSPDSILQTLWFYSTVHFGMRSVKEHHE